MKQTVRHTSIGILLLLLGACHKDAVLPPEPGESLSIAFHTQVVAEDGLSAGGSAHLLFWGEEDFHDKWIPNTGEAEGLKPHYTVRLDKEINHYTYESKIYYQTPYTYPYNYANIHATGYAPDWALTPGEGTTGDGVKDYTALTVADEFLDGSVDFLTCDGCYNHSANMNENNTFLEKEKELKFRHLTAKLAFYGERDPDMYGLVGVRNIKIRIHNQGENGYKKLMVPTRLELYTRDAKATVSSDAREVAKTNDYSTYTVSGMKDLADDGLTPQLKYTSIIPTYSKPELGRFYVISEGIEYGTISDRFDPIEGKWTSEWPAGDTDINYPRLRLDIEAELYNAEEGAAAGQFTTVTWENVDVLKDQWKDESGQLTATTGDMLLPGYEYNVTLLFNRMGIAVRAEAVPWESEELHEYPIHPLPNP